MPMQQQGFQSPLQLLFLWFTEKNGRPVVVHGNIHYQVSLDFNSMGHSIAFVEA